MSFLTYIAILVMCSLLLLQNRVEFMYLILSDITTWRPYFYILLIFVGIFFHNTLSIENVVGFKARIEERGSNGLSLISKSQPRHQVGKNDKRTCH